jgi:hypothetical protein
MAAQAVDVVEAGPELDLSVTQNVWIRCTTGSITGKKISKDTLAILGREADPMEGNVKGISDCACGLPVVRGGAVTVVVLDPIGHVQRFDRLSGAD